MQILRGRLPSCLPLEIYPEKEAGRKGDSGGAPTRPSRPNPPTPPAIRICRQFQYPRQRENILLVSGSCQGKASGRLGSSIRWKERREHHNHTDKPIPVLYRILQQCATNQVHFLGNYLLDFLYMSTNLDFPVLLSHHSQSQRSRLPWVR